MRRGQALGGARRAESGETLVELMITIVVVGLGVVAILGAIWTALRISDYHRKTTNADVVLRNYAEVLKSNSAAVPVGAGNYDASYRPCDVLGTSGTYPTYTAPAPNVELRRNGAEHPVPQRLRPHHQRADLAGPELGMPGRR